MKTHCFSVLIVMFLSYGILACKKDPPKPDPHAVEGLPDLTHEGSNTFGCLLNGNPWVAKAPFTIGGPIAIDILYKESNGGGLTIEANRISADDSVNEYMKFYVKNVTAKGSYNMSVLSQTIVGFADLTHNNFPCEGYYHDSLNPGTIQITHLDTEEHILSGLFSMTLNGAGSCTPDVKLYVTEGRFDVRY